jgi:ABC-2 type transport system permease protein
VAIVDETPPGQTVQVGGERVEVSKYTEKLFNQVQSVSVPTRAQAVKEIESGRVLAAVVIPADIASRVASGVSPGSVEVLYNGNALEQSIVRSELASALAQANLGFSEQLQRAAAQVIDSLLKGGSIGILGAPTLVGLNQISPQLRAIIAREPPGANRAALERIAAFAGFASQNLGVAKSALSIIGQPIQVKSTVVQGRRTPLDSFAVVVAVSVSLMFVSVLLAAGGVAIEREEHALPRLARGLVSREAIIAEKGLLASSCALPLAFAMLAGIGAFVSLQWSRVGLWLLALAFAALAFAALGVAIGALAREVRAASLLAFLLSLPLAFLALVPAGSVASGVEAVINAVSFVFPFKAALQALDAAVNGASPSIGISLLHLGVLTLLFGALARLGLRRLE